MNQILVKLTVASLIVAAGAFAADYIIGNNAICSYITMISMVLAVVFFVIHLLIGVFKY